MTRVLETLMRRPARVAAPVAAPVWVVVVDGVAPVEVRNRAEVLPTFDRLVRLYPGVRVRAGRVGDVDIAGVGAVAS